jgi:WhiB family redox-sensing transcriptional regulator
MTTRKNKRGTAGGRGTYSYMDLLGEYTLVDKDTDWMRWANCKGVDPEVFHPERGGSKGTVSRAKQYCYKCSVYKACMRFAIRNNIDHGIWGGLTASERRRTPQEIIDDFKPR